MRIFGVLLRRELTAFFLSVTGYIIIAAITFLTGASYVQLVGGLGKDTLPMPVTQMFFGSFYFWMILLLAAPVVTMRSFAQEKASGTFETLVLLQTTNQLSTWIGLLTLTFFAAR